MISSITLFTNDPKNSRHAVLTLTPEGGCEVACWLYAGCMARAFGNTGLKVFKTPKGAHRAATKWLGR